MASPESKGKLGDRIIAGGEFVIAGGSLLKAVQTLISAGFSGPVAIWGAFGLLVGMDAKNRWNKQS